MEKILEICRKVDKVCQDMLTLEWVPVVHTSLINTIFQAEKEGFIKKGQKVLDMGSGSGSSTFVWAGMGYDTVGIELQTQLHGAAERYAEKVRQVMPEARMRFVRGNYFPDEYYDARRGGTAEKIEETLMRSELDHIHPFGDGAYERLGMEIKDFDILYAYHWTAQAPSFFEIIERYAKPGAFVVCMTSYDKSWPEQFGLEKIGKTMLRKPISQKSLSVDDSVRRVIG